MPIKEVIQEMSDLEQKLEPMFAGLKGTPFGTSGTQVFAASKFFIMSEKKHQTAERIRMVGLDRKLASLHVRESDLFNEQGLARLRAARKALQVGKASVDRSKMSQLEETVRSDEFRDELNRVRDSIQDHIIKVDLLPEQAKEVYTIVLEKMNTLESKGYKGVLESYENDLEELENIRQKRPDRGRAPHSPLAWWKYVTLGLIAYLMAVAIAHCFATVFCAALWLIVPYFLNWHSFVSQAC